MSPELEPDEELEDVDLDLDLVGDTLHSERVGSPTTIRLDGEVIHITHAGDWPSSAMRAAGVGNWEDWAEAVIPDKEEFQVWLDSDLKNFQIEAIFQACGRKARMTMGKAPKPTGSRRRGRKK